MRKRKLKQAKHIRKNETYTKDTNEQAKVNTKRLPVNKDARLDKKLNNKRLRRKKALHLDSISFLIINWVFVHYTQL